jgi:uncharacterized protein
MKKSANKVENNNSSGSKDSISRRHFIKNASATAAAGTAGLAGFGSMGCQKKLKTVKLRRTDMKVSKFLGDRMADRKLYELALASGVNYWHKFGHWADPAPYDLFRKLDRDSIFVDTTVGSLEKDKAIEIFERALEKTGFKMIDGFKIHSQYKSAEDIKTKMGAIQAFEQLKKQGKTRYLMMSQHVNTTEVFEAAIESEMFDVIQIPVNPTVPKDYFTKDKFPRKATQDEYLGLIKKASDKGIGITAMKVFLYGAKNWAEVPDLKERVSKYLPDNQSIATALIHWALNVPGVQAYGSMLYTFDELIENLEAVGGELTDDEDRGLKKFSEAMNDHYCRMCGACERANPGGVAVSDILRFSGYYTGFGESETAKAFYAELPKSKRVDAAKDLGHYEKACPYGLPLTKMLRKAHIQLT